MRALVTGVAGFIGSNLAARLLADGHEIVGVDAYTDTYDPAQKRANVDALRHDPAFTMVEADLVDCDLSALLDGIDVVFHQAGQPGVRQSWAEGFGLYDERNIRVSQRLLDAVVHRPVRRFVFASSSSVYGNARTYPTRETDLPRPHSPYGVTKLAAEHLCSLYAEVHGVPTVSLRYFTVYGPAQRPDMLMHRLVEAALGGEPVALYGDGSQVREFTHVTDVVRANLAAAEAATEPGTVVNIAGGSETTVRTVVDLVGALVGAPVDTRMEPSKPGDVIRTAGAIEDAARLLGWRPEVGLDEGLTSQVSWHRTRRQADASTSPITTLG
jgi:nucleoside-diphosphate-sugar epimerase